MVDGKNISADECRSIFSSSKLGDRQLLVLDFLEGDRLLDVGCYAGNFVSEVKRRFPRKTVIGIDYFEDHIRIAKLVFPDLASSFRQMSIYDLEFEDGSLDCVTLQEVLEHLEGAAQAVKEINRVLKMGGVAIVSVPNPFHIGAMLSFFRFELRNAWRRFRGDRTRLGTEVYFQEIEWNRHIFSWTPQTLLTLFSVNGFEYVDHRYENGMTNPVERLFFRLFPFFGPTQILKVRKITISPAGLV
ncbi:class I SAM-dependent methyltransferase [Bradyrhizobium sp.]|uniref:class I SAM-dependent methyltransferase n=1 Tax=Bradyrhizobium sp. TaxID=376 RepID=UPI003C726EBB